MRHRYLKLGSIVLGVIVTILIIVQLIPSQSDRLIEQTEVALAAGDIDAADQALVELAAMTQDSIDLTAIVSLRLALSTARIARDNHLALEYFTLANAFSEEDPLFETYMQISDTFRTSTRMRMDEMMQLARTYQGRHYQSGLRLRSPLRGTLNLPVDDLILEEAYMRLLDGDNTPEARAMLASSVSRAAAGVVLGLVIVQNETTPPEAVRLAGEIDLAELLWLVGSNSSNVLFVQWCLERVVEETAHQPEHPARQRALDALSQIGR